MRVQRGLGAVEKNRSGLQTTQTENDFDLGTLTSVYKSLLSVEMFL